MFLLACAPPSQEDDTAPPEGPQDIRDVRLAFDLAALSAEATLQVRPAGGADAVELDVHGLSLGTATVNGEAVTPELVHGLARFPVPPGGGTVEVGVASTFESRTRKQLDGWMPELGVSFVWPEGCGNLHPCHPGLDDGIRFGLEVSGYDEGLTACTPKTASATPPRTCPRWR